MRLLRSFLVIIIFASIVSAQSLEEAYRLSIENKPAGLIQASYDQGLNWQNVGQVIYPTNKINQHGYAAAEWVETSRVAASAVNAIHLKVGSSEGKAIFSLLPVEFCQKPKKYRSYLSYSASICTDIKAGTGIFGGGLAPFVGNKVYYSNQEKSQALLPEDYQPKIGDTLYIVVERPKDYPKQIVFENRFGGAINIKYFNGEEQVVGEVLRPVVGVGRFPGSKYASAGRIRANHAGVIGVSTSQYGQIGGFQIVPANHASDITYMKTGTQWMVIGASNIFGPSFEGTAPFFKSFLQPAFITSDLTEEAWENKLLGRFLVEVQYQGQSSWSPMPIYEINEFYMKKSLPFWANSALKKVSAFRILFPVL